MCASASARWREGASARAVELALHVGEASFKRAQCGSQVGILARGRGWCKDWRFGLDTRRSNPGDRAWRIGLRAHRRESRGHLSLCCRPGQTVELIGQVVEARIDGIQMVVLLPMHGVVRGPVIAARAGFGALLRLMRWAQLILRCCMDVAHG